MKTFITTIIIAVTMLTTSFASVTPKSELSLIASAKVELSVVNVAQKDFFQVAEFDASMDVLHFVTADYVNYLQVFNEAGKLVYQLPVMSNKLKISKKMFAKGAYKIGFITKNNTTIQFTNLMVNE
jgi:putative sterol carrier protein